ncbi:acetyltransferase [Streptomyces albireticuli]|uniref:Acetyltransferase n=1 Tax=Streptomyces albireticuli TaxID=1940 RepID=A0A1Z2KY48_9ACTN|nr:acetyltransferase [Streptomyces albireticuli]
MLDFALRDRGLGRVVSVHQVGNDSSAKIMRKLGMRQDRVATDPVHGVARCVHVIEVVGSRP